MIDPNNPTSQRRRTTTRTTAAVEVTPSEQTQPPQPPQHRRERRNGDEEIPMDDETLEDAIIHHSRLLQQNHRALEELHRRRNAGAEFIQVADEWATLATLASSSSSSTAHRRRRRFPPDVETSVPPAAAALPPALITTIRGIAVEASVPGGRWMICGEPWRGSWQHREALSLWLAAWDPRRCERLRERQLRSFGRRYRTATANARAAESVLDALDDIPPPLEPIVPIDAAAAATPAAGGW